MRKMRLTFSILVLAGTALTTGTLVTGSSSAATPSSGTIGPPPAASSVSWQGPDRAATTQGPSDAQCVEPPSGDPGDFGGFCDDFTLTVSVPQRQGSVAVTLNVGGGNPGEDYDLYIYDKGGNQVGNSGNPGGVETATIDCPSPAASPYKIRVVYFTTVSDGLGYSATADYTDQTCPVSPPDRVATFNDNALAFAPSTVVSAHFLGAEPQVIMERRAPWTPQGAPIDPNRIYVDWPLSSRSGIGQLNRSLDGGDSFRPLIDLLCASRSRPNCATGGGGDTENDVNLVNGTLMFSDQEVLANEAYAVSTDHGDTFLAQTPASNTTTATDRQWLAATDNTASTPSGQPIEGFLSYHVPPQAYVQAITTDTHLPLPQPTPQLHDTGQTGQMKVDNNPTSPGHGWIYYPYAAFRGGGTWVATAPSAGWALETNWHTTKVTPNAVDSFTWIAIDHHGNAYQTWDSGGDLFYAYSPIDDARNNPALGGTPGSFWSQRARINPPSVKTIVFPELVAGDTGRIAVTYLGTSDFDGVPDDAQPSVKWHTYAGVITGAASDNPVVNTGLVSHRISHEGNICTGGTFCGLPGVGDPAKDDRSFADMIDLGFDGSGRVGVIYQDNYTNSFQNMTSADLSPFDLFSKQVSGPSVLAGSSPINVAVPGTGSRDDAQNDATWPNRAYTNPGTNLRSLDELRASLALEGGDLVARIRLADATVAGMQRDIGLYNAVPCAPPCAAERLQYVLRFYTPTDAYHLSFEVLPNGAMRSFGGKLDSNDGIANPASPTSILGSGYHTDAAYAVTAQLSNGELVLRAPASTFGLAVGSQVLSVTAFALAGPLEANETTLAYIMRTIDATPPFDAALQDVTKADLSIAKSDSPDPAKIGAALTYTLAVKNSGPAGATGVTVVDTLPKNAGYSSASTTQGTCSSKPSKNAVTCSLGTLAAGATATVTIVVKPSAKGTLTNTASVSAASPQDSNPANNNDTETTVVRP
jgi:uncharacterized repeat protein (TIGR01451 family)